MQSENKDQLREYLNQLIINHEARLGDLDIRLNTLEVRETVKKELDTKKSGDSQLMVIIKVLLAALLSALGVKYYDK